MHMDQKSQEIFDSILLKDPDQLSESEIVFLRARRSYLKKAQLQEYKSVLQSKKERQTSVKETAKTKNATK